MDFSKKPTEQETAVIKPPMVDKQELQKNEYRKVKIKISKAYHYKNNKGGAESDHEMEKESVVDTATPEVLSQTRIVTPPNTVIVIDSPPPEVPSKPFYEPDVNPPTQHTITRYTPPSSSILENILLRNRIDTNNNDNNQRQPNATPPPSSPTEMAYSYKKSHRYGAVPCSPDSSSNHPAQNLLPPSPQIQKGHHSTSPVPQTIVYSQNVPHTTDGYSSHIQHTPGYFSMYPPPSNIIHGPISSAPTSTYSPPSNTHSFGSNHPSSTMMVQNPHLMSSNLSHHLLTPLTPLQHSNITRPSPPCSLSPDNNSCTRSGSPLSPNSQGKLPFITLKLNKLTKLYFFRQSRLSKSTLSFKEERW